MTGSSRSSSSTIEISTSRVEEMIQNDRRVTFRKISSELRLIYDRVQHIVSDVLRCSKVCARWVPRSLSDEHKATRKMCSHTFLHRYYSDNQNFLYHIITGNYGVETPWITTKKAV
ncbi:histone-lysine N-methyltransferase SETMAR [Trichonephila clavipes]|nr:histone-lysine N-methyltransferase SETMAR [Trichonephila clavipes]